MQASVAAAAVELRPGDRALFASDLHLGDHAPETAERFFALLGRYAGSASHLFLLGDVFDTWIGDDWADGVSATTISRLAALSRDGLRVFAMRGNRDFLLDVPLPPSNAASPFSARCGARMLDDPCTIVLFGAPALLSHGDALCTDDDEYQRFRALTRDPGWQRAFLARPLEERIVVAQDLRARSALSKGSKADYLMDVNAAAVERAMRDAGARLLIHGHTHRPAHHRLRIDASDAQRWVLPDWEPSAHRCGMLMVSADGAEPVGAWGDVPTG